MHISAIDQRIRDLIHQDLFRTVKTIHYTGGPFAICQGKEVCVFASNDYLGLARHPKVVEAFIDGAKKYGVGSTASHLVVGHSPAHQALQDLLASWLQVEKVLLFSTGYMANLGVLSTLCSSHDLLLQDKLNHASLIDGARLSGAKHVRTKHQDLEHAELKLKQWRAQAGEDSQVFVAVDGVFSMDGDIAPLERWLDLCEQYRAFLYVDDAHGIGVLGQHGAGSFSHVNRKIHSQSLYLGTFGKALGGHGAFLAGHHNLLTYLEQKCRPYIYTTALSPAICSAMSFAIELVKNDCEGLIARLKNNITYFQGQAFDRNLDIQPSQTAIQPLLIGDTKKALALSQYLLSEHQLLVPAIRQPTVPAGTDRLRITLSALHTSTQIDQLLDAICAYR